MSNVLSDNALTILKARYLHKDETVDDLWDRVSGGNKEFRALMSNLDFLPNSPTLFNAGTNNGCTLSACFKFDVADDLVDSPNGILATRAKAAAVAKAGGGVGYYFGNIRPKGSLIKSIHRKACGPVAVLRDYHGVRSLITQGGKRDLAQMGILPCYHADVKEFIHCKDDDPKSLESFNISVSWTDEWLYDCFYNSESVAHKLWEEQVDSAWKTGDPGVYFYDVAERANPTPWLGHLTGSNPCFTGDTRVWTIYGPQRFDELVGQEVPVLTQNDNGQLIFEMMRGIRKTKKNAKVYKVRLVAKRGRGGKRLEYGEFTATGDHLVFLRDGSQIKVKNLKNGDRLSSVYRYKANQGRRALKNTAGDSDMEHKIIASYAYGSRPSYPEYHVHHKDNNGCNNHPNNLEVLPHHVHNALNMYGDNNPMRRFPERNPFRRPGFSAGPNNPMYGRHHSEETKRKISETKRRKRGKSNHQVLSVDYVGRQDVYDGTVDNTHRFFILTEDNGGVLVHNCGEVPLLNNEPCNLGSINLANFVTDNRVVDWDRLRKVAYKATLFLDNILDRNVFPHPDITNAALCTRKLGLGVMGWADMLALMQIDYDSEKAVELAGVVMKCIDDEAAKASLELGLFNGPYPGYDGTKATTKLEYRNATRTCIAPTGSISILAGCSSGIEPHFDLEWERTTNEGIKLKERIPVWDQLDGFKPKTAMEIPLEWHIKHQAAFQKYTNLATSKTINLPNSATREDVSKAYKLMWGLGCKGGTIYRDGCRSEQVLVSKKASSVYVIGSGVSQRRKLPDDCNTRRHKFYVDGTKGYLHVGLYDDGTPGEIFIRASKLGSTITGLLDTWAMAFSMAIQSGTPLEEMCELHKGARFEPCGLTKNSKLPVCTSIPDYVVRWLEQNYVHKDSNKEPERKSNSGSFCPDCGASAVYSSGCLTCSNKNCGWSRCG